MHLKRKATNDLHSDGELDLYSSKVRKKIKLISYEEQDQIFEDGINLK